MEHEQHIKEEREERKVDTSETWLREAYPEAFRKLLIDHTTNKNIIWATDSYSNYNNGEGYQFYDEITVERITGEHGNVIQPRAKKHMAEQQRRVKDKAEVFTPAWICNAQNNLIDEAWFGYPNAFNIEVTDENDTHTWIPTEGKIQFPEGKTWCDYVRDMRLEITCGEAPYLVNRYDAATGKRIGEKIDPITENTTIDLNMRIGLLDRKLRVVSENTETSGEWLKWAKTALECTYGYEWQGDSLLLAREAVFITVLEYYRAKFGKEIPSQSVDGLAYIISWNLWQMDGLKYVIPGSCEAIFDENLIGEKIQRECPGCKNGKQDSHIGIKARIRDWKVWKKIKKDDRHLPENKDKTDIPFIRVVKQP